MKIQRATVALLLIGAIIAVFSVIGWAMNQVTPERPGSAAVYQKIDSSQDCVSLQETFDRAMSNVERRPPGDWLRDVSMSYAEAALDRMGQLGCP